ncbi:DUF6640 family protein [Nocardia sp. BMG51109]|uniref:DUF6640 family protein n=1 Tax=Nocardia sp. BMG51109 TaxID=1056816 RepID=UPI0006887AE7|nr:DUF6640 family protein [Nocardia sp. BMG51109]
MTSTTRSFSAPRLLAVLVTIITAVGAVLADLVIPASAVQHLRNDAWPPHAKFHDAQYIVMTVLLSAVALTLLLQRGNPTRSRMWAACAILATPWLGLLGATLFPGTAVHDPEFDNGSILGLHPQVFMAVILLTLLVVAAAITARPEAGTESSAPSRSR